MQTYLFYDIETTGLSKCFDQILQFAAIRTDLKLNEIERYQLTVKLNPDVLPSPRALLVHGLSIARTQQGDTEYEAIRKIHQWLNQPGTISLGYNTLNFDDEFLRFSFYRNLLPPYTHQYANQCSRIDIFPMTVMFYLFRKSVLQWPEKNGKISLKLEDLNTANQLAEGQAHDAMVDVEATLALAKRFSQDAEMWSYLQGYFNKQSDNTRINKISDHAILVDSAFGFERAYQNTVYSLGFHREYKNQSIWLCLDNPDLQKSTSEDFISCNRIKHKKLGEPGFILPCHEKFLKHLSEDRLAQTEQNKLWLKQHPAILEHLIKHYTHYKLPTYSATDIQAQLYSNGFWTAEEEHICRLFHAASPTEKAKLTDRITHPILKALAMRILGRHFPEVMTTHQQKQFSAYLYQVFNHDTALDYKGEQRLTRKAALLDIEQLQQDTKNTTHVELLQNLTTYLNQLTTPG